MKLINESTKKRIQDMLDCGASVTLWGDLRAQNGFTLKTSVGVHIFIPMSEVSRLGTDDDEWAAFMLWIRGR